MSDAIMAVDDDRDSNADLMVDVAKLGYFERNDLVLDPTYGLGAWWKRFFPTHLVAHDLNPDLSPVFGSVDFRKMPHDDDQFDVVAFDPPYKLNGTGSEPDVRYGVDVYAGWKERHSLIKDGMIECFRVLRPKGYLLLKCQDQVCGGHIRWQTIEFGQFGIEYGPAELVDRLVLTGGRPQPDRTRKDGKPSNQQHARQNFSTLLIFQKKRRT